MSVYFGVPCTREQLIQLFAAVRGIKTTQHLPASTLFELIKACENWDHRGIYVDLDDNADYLFQLIPREKEFRNFVHFDNRGDIDFIGIPINVRGTVLISSLVVPTAEETSTFKNSALYAHLHASPSMYYIQDV